MAASIEAITDAEVTMVRNNGDWAMFVLREWDKPGLPDRFRGGSIAVQTRYGAFSYIWGSTGCPFKQFVREHLATDWHYTMKKLLNSEGDTAAMYEFDLELSIKEAKRVLLSKRREQGLYADEQHREFEKGKTLRYAPPSGSEKRRDARLLTKERARELWDQLDRDGDKDSLTDTLMSETGIAAWGDDGYECIRKSVKTWIKPFFDDLFVPYAQQLSVEKMKERARK